MDDTVVVSQKQTAKKLKCYDKNLGENFFFYYLKTSSSTANYPLTDEETVSLWPRIIIIIIIIITDIITFSSL